MDLHFRRVTGGGRGQLGAQDRLQSHQLGRCCSDQVTEDPGSGERVATDGLCRAGDRETSSETCETGHLEEQQSRHRGRKCEAGRRSPREEGVTVNIWLESVAEAAHEAPLKTCHQHPHPQRGLRRPLWGHGLPYPPGTPTRALLSALHGGQHTRKNTVALKLRTTSPETRFKIHFFKKTACTLGNA